MEIVSSYFLQRIARSGLDVVGVSQKIAFSVLFCVIRVKQCEICEAVRRGVGTRSKVEKELIRKRSFRCK